MLNLFPVLLARGRGLGKLIAAAMDGEPWAIGILALIIVIFVGVAVYKMKRKTDS